MSLRTHLRTVERRHPPHGEFEHLSDEELFERCRALRAELIAAGVEPPIPTDFAKENPELLRRLTE